MWWQIYIVCDCFLVTVVSILYVNINNLVMLFWIWLPNFVDRGILNWFCISAFLVLPWKESVHELCGNPRQWLRKIWGYDTWCRRAVPNDWADVLLFFSVNFYFVFYANRKPFHDPLKYYNENCHENKICIEGLAFNQAII